MSNQFSRDLNQLQNKTTESLFLLVPPFPERKSFQGVRGGRPLKRRPGPVPAAPVGPEQQPRKPAVTNSEGTTRFPSATNLVRAQAKSARMSRYTCFPSSSSPEHEGAAAAVAAARAGGRRFHLLGQRSCKATPGSRSAGRARTPGPGNNEPCQQDSLRVELPD